MKAILPIGVSMIALASIFADSMATGQAPQPQPQTTPIQRLENEAAKIQIRRPTFNCSALKGQPFVCFYNETNQAVTDIDCEVSGFFGSKSTKEITMPKGGIVPHSLTIVNMKSCKTALIFTMAGGPQKRIDKVDTDQAVYLEVPK